MVEASRNRLFAVALFLVFALPIAMAWWLNLSPGAGISSLHVTGNGSKVVTRAPYVAQGGLTNLRDRFPTSAYFRNDWTLLVVNDDHECYLPCTAALLMTRQVHWALGRRLSRVRRALVRTGPIDTRGTRRLLQHADAYGQVLALRATSAWRDQLESVLAPGDSLDNSVFLVDPNGRLVLYYNVDNDPQGLLKDVKRLLRLSKIG